MKAERDVCKMKNLFCFQTCTVKWQDSGMIQSQPGPDKIRERKGLEGNKDHILISFWKALSYVLSKYAK